MKTIYYTFLICMITFFSCSNATPSTDPIPDHQTFKIQSKRVNEERTINVWVPKDYDTSNLSYPVIYMADGGIKEDFPHMANTIMELIATNKIKPVLLVGIENTERRRDLTGPTSVEKDKEIAPIVGGSANFRAFINDELFPEINKRYRTSTVRTLIGESVAGLFVMETLIKEPEMFDHYIAFDPSLWWNNNSLVSTIKINPIQHFKTPKRLWFAGSSAKDIYPSTRELNQILNQQKPSNLKWLYSDEPKEKHNTIFRATKEKALIWMLNP